jgi:hypothetical protein
MTGVALLQGMTGGGLPSQAGQDAALLGMMGKDFYL